MRLNIRDSIVIVSSSDSKNDTFGTGFVIHQAENVTYVVTCTHVVENVGGEGMIKVAEHPATVVVSDSESGFDIAVLRVEKLLESISLKPGYFALKGSEFATAGFYNVGPQTVAQSLEGILDEEARVLSSESEDSVPFWHINIQNEKYYLEPGYSGAPLVDKRTDLVWGVVNNRKGKGQTGMAVSIEAVKKIWKDRPWGIFENIKKSNVAEDMNTVMPSTKAIAFTNFRFKGFNPLSPNEDYYIRKYGKILEKFMVCNRDSLMLSIVYAYVDWAVQNAISDLKVDEIEGQSRFFLDGHFVQEESRLKGILKKAEEEVRLKLGMSPNDPPRFFYVGLLELVAVLNNLVEVDADMPLFLCGNEGHFTYDSPKFMEAVIRLSRADISHLAGHPIIRVDEDSQINPYNIKLLLDQFRKISIRKPFFFFSGMYGRADGRYDPINDYAVRTHWFFPPDTKAGDPRFVNPDEDFRLRIDAAETFLADFAVLGATQPTKHENSQHLQDLCANGDLKRPPSRSSAQVISGAGLIMSRRSIDILPPFMNLEHMTSWIDDHLKRRLHEMLYDIDPIDLESASTEDLKARFQQERPPMEDPKPYFDRLLRGCLFHAIITDQEGEPTKYSEIIRDIALYKKIPLEENEIKSIRRLEEKERTSIGEEISKLAQDRYDKVLHCWSSPEFEKYASYKWAQKCLENNDHKEKLCNEQTGEVTQDALAYIDLMLNWPVFTRSIERLSFLTNSWLFEPVQ